ncbi:MAG TPA: hypothetical protein H9923_03185 [Candidatus Dwaynia gallinarum]|nr:hypothetical protein [Candidatus Dwaynia gallinarum]
MDTYSHLNITDILEIIRKVNPIKILDVNVGFGRWGILCRELLERDNNGKVRRPDLWNIKIDGVENIDTNYLHNYHDIFYDNIYRQNIHGFLKTHVSLYDLTIFSNILECTPKEIAIDMINNAMEISRFILIYVKLGNHSDNFTADNEVMSIWDEQDFLKYFIINKIILNDRQGNKYGIFLLECDTIKRIYNRNVVIYGIDDYFDLSVKPFINENNIICFMEENVFKQGLFFMGKMIYTIKGVKKIKDDFVIIIASVFYREIKRKLEAAHLYNFI